MKFSEIILDRLSESRLFEMVRDRQRALDSVRNLSEILQDHLIKILMYDKHEYEHAGWLSELKAFDSQMVDAMNRYYRKTGKVLSESSILEIFLEYTQTINSVERIVADIQRTVYKYATLHNLPVLKPIKEARFIHRDLMNILPIISSDLSDRDLTDFDQIVKEFL